MVMPFNRDEIQPRLADLARRGVYVGASSWKYPGWRGLLYDDSRYVWRGKFAESRFEKYCLGEYAGVFKTVCVDAAYYKFPDREYLESLVSQTPPGFRFTFKVTDDITIKRFPRLPRFGVRAGKPNEHYLNAELFQSAFLAPCEPFRASLGVLVLEFSKFNLTDYQHGREFVADLDAFLGKLPAGWPLAVEIRNRNFLHPEYFAMLRQHRVAHLYNHWTGMPTALEQMALPGSRTGGLRVARLLVRPGRTFEQAVKLFQPYDQIREPNAEAREAAVRLIEEGLAAGPQNPTYVYVNNRLEGNSLGTIDAVLSASGEPGAPAAL